MINIITSEDINHHSTLLYESQKINYT